MYKIRLNSFIDLFNKFVILIIIITVFIFKKIDLTT